MKGALIDGALIGRTIDNSQVVREVDPRASRELVAVAATVLLLVAGLGAYAWPHFAARQVGAATESLQRERERLIEENRKLRLEMASLEDLRRVERIAIERLGLRAPEPERVVIVERTTAVPAGSQVATHGDATPAVQ